MIQHKVKQTNNQAMKKEELFEAFLDSIALLVAAKIEQPKTAEVKTERKKLVGIRGIAKYLGVNPGTVQRMKDRGEFPTYWVGNRVYTYSDELENSIKKNGGLKK